MFSRNCNKIVILLFLYLIHIYLIPKVMVDDAFISFRYANNFFNGFGLVYNVGEYVEGYSNFLWVIILSFSKYFFFNIPDFARYLGFTLGFINILLLYKLSFFSISKNNLIVPLLLIFSPQYIIWMGCGLEYPIYIFLILLSIIELFKLKNNRINYFYFSFLLISIYLTRPEGIGILLIFLWFILKKSPPKKVILLSLMCSIAIIVHLIWRYNYYGMFLPNTYYAKAGLSFRVIKRGIIYLINYISDFKFLFIYLFFFIFGIRRISHIYFFLIGYFLFFIIMVGGDHAVYYRFIVPILPLFFIICVNGLEKLKMRNVYFYIIIFLLIIGLFYPTLFYKSRINDFLRNEARMLKEWKIIGEYLKVHIDSNKVLCMANAGVVPYYSELKTIDTYGLTDFNIAKTGFNKSYFQEDLGMPGHERAAPDYIFKLSPDYYFGSPMLVSNSKLSDLEDDIIFNGPGDYKLRKLIKSSRKYELNYFKINQKYLFFYKKIDSLIK